MAKTIIGEVERVLRDHPEDGVDIKTVVDIVGCEPHQASTNLSLLFRQGKAKRTKDGYRSFQYFPLSSPEGEKATPKAFPKPAFVVRKILRYELELPGGKVVEITEAQYKELA